jgi:hypothetical protein
MLGFSLVSGCSEKEDPKPSEGCLTGINNDGVRVQIRCCTREEYLAGSNVNAGGTASWESYTGHKWELCDSCN